MSAVMMEEYAAGLRRFKRYPEYKDSGVEWLGEIPGHWEVSRLKFIVEAPLKYGANEAAEIEDPDQPRYVRITDIDESDGLRDETFKCFRQLDLAHFDTLIWPTLGTSTVVLQGSALQV